MCSIALDFLLARLLDMTLIFRKASEAKMIPLSQLTGVNDVLNSCIALNIQQTPY